MRSLVEQRFAMLAEDEPYDPDLFGYFIVVDGGDRVTTLDEQLGFPILSNRFDGTHFGDPGFTPCHEILEEHTGCYEMVFVLSDDGYGVEVFIPKSGVDADLLALCQRYAIPAREPTA
jgi:hypothetical protein